MNKVSLRCWDLPMARTTPQSGEILEHLVGSLCGGHSPCEPRIPLTKRTLLTNIFQKVLLVQLRFSIEASGLPLEIGVALLECHLPEEVQEESQPDIEILEADFFDDESVVIVYRLQTRESKLKTGVSRLPDIDRKHRTGFYSDTRLQRYELPEISVGRPRKASRPRRFDAGCPEELEGTSGQASVINTLFPTCC